MMFPDGRSNILAFFHLLLSFLIYVGEAEIEQSAFVYFRSIA